MPQRLQFIQLDWSLLGPLVVVFALIVGISGFVVSLTTPAQVPAAPAVPAAANTPSRVPGTGGGVDLRPPALVKSQLFALSSRVTGSPTIRTGPGAQYPVVARATDGQELHVIACDSGCHWLRVFSLTDDAQWWLPASFLTVSGNTSELPVLTPVETAQ